jgi:hypothetical protein
MFKRIGPLTIIGILVIIAVAVLFLVPSSSMLWDWYVFLILGFIFGVFLVVVDFIYTQRRIGNKIFDPRLFVFIKIVIIGFIALIINAVILMTALGSNAGFFTDYVCLIFYIPGILVGVGIFLILLRTPAAKYIESKKMRYFYVIFAVLIVVLPIIVGWPMLSPTYTGRQPIRQLHLSFDGSRLVSISGGMHLASEETHDYNQIYDHIIWNTSSGKIIWNETTPDYFDTKISPNGEYSISSMSNSIISVTSGENIINFSGTYYDWSANGNFFVTINENLVNIWNATNFSIMKTIPMHGSVRKIALSPDGSRLAVDVHEQKQNSLLLINVSSENSTAFYNYSEYSVYNIQYLSWPKNGDELQMVKYELTSHTSSDYADDYKLIIWNISDKNILYNLSFKYEMGKMAMNKLADVEFGKYVIYDYEKSKLISYNLTGLETVINMNQNFLNNFDLSYDGTLMALGSNGIIKIINVMTGKTINTLQTPQYEIIRPIPGFELILLIIAMALILIWKRKRMK